MHAARFGGTGPHCHTQESEAGGLYVQGLAGLPCEFKESLHKDSLCLKTNGGEDG